MLKLSFCWRYIHGISWSWFNNLHRILSPNSHFCSPDGLDMSSKPLRCRPRHQMNLPHLSWWSGHETNMAEHCPSFKISVGWLFIIAIWIQNTILPFVSFCLAASSVLLFYSQHYCLRMICGKPIDTSKSSQQRFETSFGLIHIGWAENITIF